MNLNRATIIGRVTKKPELRALPNGNKVCNFSIATNYSYKNKDTGEKVEETDFHNVVSFGKQAEVIAQYVIQGQEILAEGRLRTRSWEKDGQKHYATDIIMDKFEFGQKPKGAVTTQTSQVEGKGADLDDLDLGDGDPNIDDIPF